MCGIIGYLGPKEVVPILIDGLRRLEYRGYDSAGVAVVRNGQIERRRSAGKLVNLEQAIDTQPLEGIYGVGHTRWATHGRPTEENAHPHQDCTGKIVVVHNGIIENYLDLKRELQKLGHTFVTETDTEIIAHLLEQEMASDGTSSRMPRGRRSCTCADSLRSWRSRRTTRKRSSRCATARPSSSGSARTSSSWRPTRRPFSATRATWCFSATRRWRSSRAAAWSSRTSPARRSRRRRSGCCGTRSWRRSRATAISCSRRSSSSRARPKRRCSAASQLDTGHVFLEEIAISEADLRGINKVALIACGTSWHAALVGKFLIERFAGLPVEVDYGSEYRYRDFIVDRHTLVVIITQSGETADTLAALREARKKGARSLAICNVVGSMATRESEGTIYTHAGPEIGVASTKAFTSQLVALNLLALFLGQVKGTLSDADARQHIDALVQLPKQMEQALKASARSKRSPAASSTAATSCTSAAASTTRLRSKAR